MGFGAIAFPEIKRNIESMADGIVRPRLEQSFLEQSRPAPYRIPMGK